MKTKIYLIITLLSAFLLNSCQEVVDIPLDTENPRLVIDASINWLKGTPGNDQKIKLTTTTNFYSSTIPTVSGATVFITNSANTVFNFIETPSTGEYYCTNFAPVLEEIYALTVIVNGQTYNATETLKSVAAITNVTEETQTGFGTNVKKVKTLFHDPANADNYYMYRYKLASKLKPNYSVDDDTFFQGNDFFSLAFIEDSTPGETLEITHFGVSQQFYNYMNILLSVAGSQGGGPFQSPPATVKGNIKNTTDFPNYPLGYFRLSEVDTTIHTML